MASVMSIMRRFRCGESSALLRRFGCGESSTALGRFGRDEGGTVMVEALLVLPMLLWSYLALFVYWDAFRSLNTAQKAAYTISDTISREMVSLSPAYIPGLRNMMQYLVHENDSVVKLRVTSITYNSTDSRYEVHWSRSPDGAFPELTTATLQQFADCDPATIKPGSCIIPKMADGDYVILVETSIPYHPAFNVGVNDQELREFIVTRPRFLPKICLTGVVCPV